MKKKGIIAILIILFIFFYHDLVQELLTIIINNSLRIFTVIGILIAVIFGIKLFRKSKDSNVSHEDSINSTVVDMNDDSAKDKMDIF